MKISTQLQFNRAAAQMGTLTGNLSAQQARISSGTAFNAPREAPQDATTLLRLDALKTGQEARLGLLDRAEARARAQEASLRSASDILIRVKELAIQASNGTYNAADRRTFALEVRALNDELLALANTQDAEGNAVFAGAATAAQAFQKDPSGAVQYLGDSTGVELSVGGNRALNIARPGTTYFGPVSVPGGPRILSDSALESFTVEGSAGAEPGSYAVTIAQLAQGQSSLSTAFDSSDVALNSGNPLSLTVGQAGAVQTLTINSPTPEAIAEALNSAELGLSAELRVLDEAMGSVALVVDGGTGADAAFSLDDPTGELGWATVQNALNAQAEINGEAQESATNRFELGAGLSIEATSVGLEETFEVRTRDGFFTVLETFAEGLEANVQQQDRSLAQLETMLESMSLGLARVGTDLSAVERTRDVMAEEQLQTDALISDLRDLDFAEAITKLRADQLALEAAQSSFARIAGQSLFDFLR